MEANFIPGAIYKAKVAAKNTKGWGEETEVLVINAPHASPKYFDEDWEVSAPKLESLKSDKVLLSWPIPLISGGSQILG